MAKPTPSGSNNIMESNMYAYDVVVVGVVVVGVVVVTTVFANDQIFVNASAH